MNKLLTLLVSVFICSYAQAVEYVTLSASTPTRAVASNSLVEIVGCSVIGNASAGTLELTLADGEVFEMQLAGLVNKSNTATSPASGTVNPNIIGQKFIGLSSITLPFAPDGYQDGISNPAVTLKITPASEINPVGPNTFLVMPEGATGNFDVILESSNDLTNWAPFTSQSVSASTSPTFFRARIIQAE